VSARRARARRAWPYRTEAVFFVHTTFFFGRESTPGEEGRARQIGSQLCQIGDQANVGCPVGVARAGDVRVTGSSSGQGSQASSGECVI
jgi:hypothetical protein